MKIPLASKRSTFLWRSIRTCFGRVISLSHRALLLCLWFQSPVSECYQHVHQTRPLFALGLGTLYYYNTIIIYCKWCRVTGWTHYLNNTGSSSNIAIYISIDYIVKQTCDYCSICSLRAPTRACSQATVFVMMNREPQPLFYVELLDSWNFVKTMRDAWILLKVVPETGSWSPLCHPLNFAYAKWGHQSRLISMV